MNRDEQKWVQDMLEKASKKEETKPTTKNDGVDQKEVEDLTKSIQRRIQRGE